MKIKILAAIGAILSLLTLRVQADITTGLVGHWTFDNTSGSLAVDSSGTGSDGTLVNFSDTGFTSMWTTNGWFNNALLFNQGGDVQNYVSIPDSTNMDVSVTKQFTLAAWVKLSSFASSQGAILCKGAGGAESYCLDFNGNKFRVFMRNSSGGSTMAATGVTVPGQGTWYHVVGTYRSTGTPKVVLYVNGVADGDSGGGTLTTIFKNTHEVTIGCRESSASSGYNLPFKGTMDDVRIYNRAFSASDVLELYTNNAPLPVIATQPRSVTCYSNDTVQFTVKVDTTRSLAPVTYQWRLAGNPIAGATTSSLVLSNVTTAREGAYSVLVSNYMGTVLSDPAVLTVRSLPPADAASGLAGYWKFNEAGGSATAADSSGNGNTGALNGFSDSTYTSMWGDGIINGGLSFNGDGFGSSVVAVPGIGMPAPSVLDFSASPVFTLSAWVKGAAVQKSGAGIIAKGTGNGGEQYVLEVNSGNYRFFVRDANGVVFTAQTAIPPGGFWQHVVAVLNATNGIMNCYVNGTLAAYAVAPFSLLANSHEMSIGNRQPGTADYANAFTGAIDDVRVYNRDLTSADVFALYASAAYPIITAQSPTTYTDRSTLYAGSSPAFKITSVTGLTPFSYQWYTNGVADPAGTNANYQLYNLPVGGMTNYCVVTNTIGSSTSFVWTASVISAPTQPYPAAVLAANPIGYWRLNEAENGLYNGNAGEVAHDYWKGNNGVYTNSSLEQPGYNSTTDPATTSALFGTMTFTDSGAFNIGGIDFATPTNNSTAFSIQAWVNGWSQTSDAGIVTKGYGNGGEQFNLDTGGPGRGFRFLVRNAAGAGYSASTSIQPGNTWHHLVGVCDQPNGTVKLYVDGVLVGTTAIPPGSGILASTNAMSIGSRKSGASATAYNNQFVGYVNDVAVYNYALTGNQVESQYVAAGIAPQFVQQPPATTNVSEGQTLTIVVKNLGTAPLVNQWWDASTGMPIVGQTNATLVISNLSTSLNNHQLYLRASNAYGTVDSSMVTLSIISGPPQFTLNLPPKVTSVTGKIYRYSAQVIGTVPISYQWYSGESPLAGETNSTYTLTAGSPGSYTYKVVASNSYGTVTSTVSTLTSVPQLTDAYATQILGLGAAGYWPLQETNAPAAVTMEINHGTLGRLGNAYYAATNAEDVTFAQAGALTGSGDNDTAVTLSASRNDSYAFVPRVSPDLTLRPPFSVECWLYSSSTTFHDLMGQSGSGLNSTGGNGNWAGWRLSYGNPAGGPSLQFYASPGTGTTRNSVGTPANSLPINQWHHCVATYDGTNVVLYIDGQELASGQFAMAIDTWTPITIGGGMFYSGAPQRKFSGTLDEVAVYTNVLTATQVTNHWLAGTTMGSNYMATASADNPLLYYRMNAAAYTNAPAVSCPEAVNYGSAPVNGNYLPGMSPGAVTGPSLMGAGSDLAAPGNGIISCVDAGYDPIFNPTGTQPFSVMTWFKAYPADGVVQTLMSQGQNWAMNLDGTTGRVVWNLNGAGNVTSSMILNDGNWHQVVGVYSGANSYLYVDGALNGSITATGGLTGEANASLYLGGNVNYRQVSGNERYFAGALAYAAYFTNALTGTQIQQVYANAAVPTISMAGSGGNLVITYTGTLLSSPNVEGPYTPVAGATSPYVVAPTAEQKFYRAGRP